MQGFKPLPHGNSPNWIVENYTKSFSQLHCPKTSDSCKFLYLIKREFSNLYKIGVTNNPEKRFKKIVTASGCMVQDLIVLKCQVDYDESPLFIESFLHEYFKQKRKYGEWFELSIKDVVAIRQLLWSIEGEEIFDNTRKYLTTLKTKTQNPK